MRPTMVVPIVVILLAAAAVLFVRSTAGGRLVGRASGTAAVLTGLDAS